MALDAVPLVEFLLHEDAVGERIKDLRGWHVHDTPERYLMNLVGTILSDRTRDQIDCGMARFQRVESRHLWICHRILWTQVRSCCMVPARSRLVCHIFDYI